MMIDIDYFKKVNDTYGHDIGDLVLKKTAAVLQQSVRGSDVVCRLGGEEFLVICKKAALQDGLMVAERLRANVAANQISAPGFEGTCTVSIGVASWVKGMAHPDELLKQADLAVYEAKRTGRNRVCSGGEKEQG
jgi:diguanylate cyclase (GGDEF)-like protein